MQPNLCSTQLGFRIVQKRLENQELVGMLCIVIGNISPAVGVLLERDLEHFMKLLPPCSAASSHYAATDSMAYGLGKSPPYQYLGP